MAKHHTLSGKNVLIVGASSGLAAEAAIQLAHRGNAIGLVARRAEALNAVAEGVVRAGGSAKTWTADATDPEQMAKVVAEASAEFGRLDVVWANAGQGPDMPMESFTPADTAEMIRLNYEVLVSVLIPAIAHFREQGGGHFVHTNSLASLLGVPRQGPYGAAKVAGRLLIDAARTELSREGLRFTSLFPGFVATERIANDGLPKPFQITVEQAARRSIQAIERQERNAYFPRSITTLIRVLQLLPSPIREATLRQMAR